MDLSSVCGPLDFPCVPPGPCCWTALCLVDLSSVHRPSYIACGPPGPCCLLWNNDHWTFLVFRPDRAVYCGIMTIGLSLYSAWTVLDRAEPCCWTVLLDRAVGPCCWTVLLDRAVGPCCAWWTYRHCTGHWTSHMFRLDRVTYCGRIMSARTIGH